MCRPFPDCLSGPPAPADCRLINPGDVGSGCVRCSPRDGVGLGCDSPAADIDVIAGGSEKDPGTIAQRNVARARRIFLERADTACRVESAAEHGTLMMVRVSEDNSSCCN